MVWRRFYLIESWQGNNRKDNRETNSSERRLLGHTMLKQWRNQTFVFSLIQMSLPISGNKLRERQMCWTTCGNLFMTYLVASYSPNLLHKIRQNQHDQDMKSMGKIHPPFTFKPLIKYHSRFLCFSILKPGSQSHCVYCVSVFLLNDPNRMTFCVESQVKILMTLLVRLLMNCRVLEVCLQFMFDTLKLIA